MVEFMVALEINTFSVNKPRYRIFKSIVLYLW